MTNCHKASGCVCADCRIFAVERWRISKSRTRWRSNAVTWRSCSMLLFHYSSASQYTIIIIIIILWVPWRRPRFSEHAVIICHIRFIVRVRCWAHQYSAVPVSWLSEGCSVIRRHQRECFHPILFTPCGCLSLATWNHTVLPATRHKYTHSALTPARGRYSIYLPRKDGRLSWLSDRLHT